MTTTTTCVQNLMIENIDKVLDRGEKIELLVDRTEDLTESAQDFRYKSRKLKNKMFWKNVQLVVILVLIILAVLLVIVWLACGIFPPVCIVPLAALMLQVYCVVHTVYISTPSNLHLQFGNCIKLFKSS